MSLLLALVGGGGPPTININLSGNSNTASISSLLCSFNLPNTGISVLGSVGTTTANLNLSVTNIRSVIHNRMGRTNLFKYSNGFTDANWSKARLTVGTVTAPDGSPCFTLTATGVGDPLVQQSVTVGTVKSRTFTAQFKAWIDSGQSTECTLYIYNGAVTDIGELGVTLTTTPTVYTITKTFLSTTVDGNVIARIDPINVGTAGQYMYVQYAQLEESAIATSYIPTTTVAATVNTATITEDITNVGSSNTIGTLVPTGSVNVNANITGVSSAGIVGVCVPGSSFNITGNSFTTLPGNLSNTLSFTVNGNLGTNSVNSLTTALRPTFNGVTSNSTLGTINLSQTVTSNGVLSTSNVGSLLKTLGINNTGVLGSLSLNNIAPGTRVLVSSNTLTGTIAELSANISLLVPGNQFTSIINTLTASQSGSDFDSIYSSTINNYIQFENNELVIVSTVTSNVVKSSNTNIVVRETQGVNFVNQTNAQIYITEIESQHEVMG